MRITTTRKTTTDTTLFHATEANALTLMRDHVRAIDDSEDDLLKLYLGAAIDYMQELTGRLLGEHDVTLYIDRDESKKLFTAPIDSAISVKALYYRAEDPDETEPFATSYELITRDAINTTEDYIFGDDDDWKNGLIYKVGGSNFDQNVVVPVKVNVIDTDLGDGNIDDVGFTLKQKQPDGTFKAGVTNSDTGFSVGGLSVDENGTENYVIGRLYAGIYRIEAQARNGVGQQAVSIGDPQYRYIIVSDGTDFDNLIDIDTYPINIDIRKGLDVKEVVDNGSDYDKHFWKMHFTAGTELDSLPRQYKQAALLLIGHYYNMREAENIGGITTEVKEGVRRLMQSVRNF